MGNMAHCRFVNTVEDLRDCQKHMDDNDLSPEEQKSMLKLVLLCQDIAFDFRNIEE